MYNIKGMSCKYLFSKKLQLWCPLVPHLFIFGALMDRVLNWQRKYEQNFLKYLLQWKIEAFLSSF
jgi:hypothetical protein